MKKGQIAQGKVTHIIFPNKGVVVTDEQEKVIVKALVDDNRVFRVLVRSTMRADEFQRVWEYAGLKFYYKLK